MAVAGPRRILLRHKKFRVDPGHLVGQPGEVQIPWHHAVLQRENRLHHPQRPGRRLQVAEVGLDRPQHTRPVGSVHRGQAGVFDRIADRGAGAVRLDEADRGGVDVRRLQRLSVDGDLSRFRGRGDVDGAAVLVGGGAPQHRQDAVAVAPGVVEPLEQQHHASLTGDEAVGVHVEGVAAAGRGQHALQRTRHRLAWFQGHHHPTGQGEVAFAAAQAAAGLVHGHQPGRARRVHRDRRPVQAQRVGDPPGGEAVGGAGESVRALGRAAVGGQQFVVAVRQPDEHAGLRSGQRRGVQARVFDGVPRRFQQQPVLRVDRGGLALGHPEEVAVEAPHVVEERPPPGDRPAGHAGLGVVVEVRVPPVGGNLADQVVTAQQCLPEALRGIDPAGKPAGHSDDGNGCGSCGTQCAVPCSRPLPWPARPVSSRVPEEVRTAVIVQMSIYLRNHARLAGVKNFSRG